MAILAILHLKITSVVATGKNKSIMKANEKK